MREDTKVDGVHPSLDPTVLKYLGWNVRLASQDRLRPTCSPCTKATGKSAMQTLQAPLVSNLLLPHRHIRAVVANVRVEGGEGGPEGYEGGLLGLKICFEIRTRPFARHGEDGIGDGAMICSDKVIMMEKAAMLISALWLGGEAWWGNVIGS